MLQAFIPYSVNYRYWWDFGMSISLSRALAVFWSLFMVVIFATYTANLAAYLTVTIINLPIKSFEDLANSASVWPIVKKGSSYIGLF